MTKYKLIYKRVLLLFLTFFGLFILGFYVFFSNRVYPFVYINDIAVGGRTFDEAKKLVNQKTRFPDTVVFEKDGNKFSLNLSLIDLKYDVDRTLLDAFYGERGHLFAQRHINLQFSFDEQSFKDFVNKNLGSKFNKEAAEPTVSVSNKDVVIDKGSVGYEVDLDQLTRFLNYFLAHPKENKIEIPIKTIDPTITNEQADILKSRSLGLLSKNLKLTYEKQVFNYKGDELVSLLSFDSYSENSLRKFVSNLESSIDVDPRDATFVFSNGKVSQFTAPSSGVYIEKDGLISKLKDSLKKLETSEEKSLSFEIPTSTIDPKNTISDTNSLGIRELVGSGKSRFLHSALSRIHNILVATNRINGLLIKPEETFSFNNALGDVSKFTGYQEAYIIENGKTVLGDGGGVCQVSTTLFRAALKTGLPIVSRTAHAYRVGYYEQDSLPGLDATVYSPYPDLRIKNDTPAYILIQAHADLNTATLYFDLYGASDGRVATVSAPVITDQTPPLPDEYSDDPTLPSGQVKQVDWAAYGAKVKFDYTVTRDGKTIIQRAFESDYQPWSNKFLRGTHPL